MKILYSLMVIMILRQVSDVYYYYVILTFNIASVIYCIIAAYQITTFISQ